MQLFVSKASLWFNIILTQGELNGINYFIIIQPNKNGKEMKTTKHHRHIGLSLLFMFILGKWTSFYAAKGLQHS